MKFFTPFLGVLLLVIILYLLFPPAVLHTLRLLLRIIILLSLSLHVLLFLSLPTTLLVLLGRHPPFHRAYNHLLFFLEYLWTLYIILNLSVFALLLPLRVTLHCLHLFCLLLQIIILVMAIAIHLLRLLFRKLYLL